MMSWTRELDFVEAFVLTVVPQLHRRTHRYQAFREKRTGYGRPDVIIVEYEPKILVARPIVHSHRPLTNLSAYAMSYMSSRSWVTTETVRRFLNCTNSELETVIGELTSRNMLLKRGHLIKSRPKSEILAIRRIWVYEAKLFQWKAAIIQAERHLWFSKDSFILLPSTFGSVLTTVSKECRKRGIGLCTFSDVLGMREVVAPASSGLINSPFLWKLNEDLIGDYYGKTDA